jgi:hypothetical protein
MKIHTLTYKNSTWSETSFPNCDSDRTLILIFYSPHFFNNHIPFEELKEKYPHSVIGGCSTSGEIHDAKIDDDSLSVAIVQFEKTVIKTCEFPINDYIESFEIGNKIGATLNSESLKGILLLSDGIIVNGTDLVEGVKKSVNSDVLVTGGLAGDGENFLKTSVLKNSVPTTKFVSAVGFYGNEIKISFGSYGGWEAFGPERIITRSHKNILYEIDGKPALDFYKEYLGEKAKDLPAAALLYPLGISDKPHEKKVVRTVLSINNDEKSMVFAGNIPQGWYARLMQARVENLIEAALIAAQSANMNIVRSSEKLAIAISCVGRRLVLKDKTVDEVEAVLDTLGKKTRLVGFYSYGEISPTGKVSTCDLHNQTMTITTITEKI